MSEARKFRYGLAHRISFLVMVIVVVGVASMGAVFVYSKHSSDERKLNDEINSTLKFASSSLSEPLWSFNDSTISSVVKSLVNSDHRYIVAVQVFDRDLEKVSEVFREGVKSVDFDSVKNDDAYVISEGPITYQNEQIGTVRVLSSVRVIKIELQNLAVIVSLYVILAAFFMSLMVYYSMRSTLTIPLENLLVAVKRAQNAEYTQTVMVDYKYELGELASAFNESLFQISSRDQKLKVYAENLQHMVEERTKELEAQRQNSIHNARLAALGEVSAGIAHEVNNPLSVIDGHAKHLSMIIKGLPNEADLLNHLEKIRNMVKRVGKIVKGLRTFARDGSRDPMAPITIARFVDEVQDLCLSKLKSSMVKLTVENRSSQTYAMGREIQLSQVIINLINNAADAVSELQEKWVKLEVFDTENDLVFAITDSGKGIPKEILDKIMEPFFTTKEIGKGTGLGLSISLGIAKEHGGDLAYVDGGPNTRFELRIPRIDSKRNTTENASKAS